MAITTKVTRKVGWKIEGTPGTYDAPSVQFPFTEFGLKQGFDLIEDKSIVGVAFPDLPLQGVRKVGGPIGGEVDVATIVVILEAALGAASSKVYSLPVDKNEKTLTFVSLDAVKANKYAGCVVNNFKLSSKSGAALEFSSDILGWRAEDRDATTDFPSLTTLAGTKLTHLHMGQTNGYFRIGDQVNALVAGDNLANIDSVEVGHNWNFAESMVNDAGTLQLLSGEGGDPEGDFSFTIARHESDAFKTYRDDRTVLQAEILYYASSTAQLKIQIPNLIVESVDDTGDNVTKLPIKCRIARNGIGQSYSNANMAFVTPIRITVTNS